MNSNADAAAEGSSGDGRTPAARLAELDALLAQVQQATAKAVLLVGSLAGSGTAEAVAGLPLELHLGLSARMTGADRAVFIAAGEALRQMPVTAALFARGAISWGQVRGIVRAVRRLALAERSRVDQRLGQTVTDRGVDGFDPDELVWAVEQAALELRDRRGVERSERRRASGGYLAVQPDFEGGIRGWFELADPVAAATVINGLDARAGVPQASGDSPAAPPVPGSPTSRATQYAQALVGLCGDALAGSPTTTGAARPAKPLVLIHVDLGQVHVNTAGQVELNVRGPVPTICARTVEALAHDADLRAVLFDGARPLATSNKVRAKAIPSDTRVAVRVRDKGCRFPGSTDPAGHSDVHHAVHRCDGGDHSPDNLLLLSRRFHTLVHNHGWNLRVDDDGAVTATRGTRTYRSLPPGTPLARAPAPPAPPLAPDGLPF